jgi:hypothetical protein
MPFARVEKYPAWFEAYRTQPPGTGSAVGDRRRTWFTGERVWAIGTQSHTEVSRSRQVDSEIGRANVDFEPHPESEDTHPGLTARASSSRGNHKPGGGCRTSWPLVDSRRSRSSSTEPCSTRSRTEAGPVHTAASVCVWARPASARRGGDGRRFTSEEVQCRP